MFTGIDTIRRPERLGTWIVTVAKCERIKHLQFAVAKVEDRLWDGSAPIDLLVNSAGIVAVGRFWEADLNVLRAQYDPGTTAVFLLGRAATGGMVERDRGALINLVSFGALLPGRNAAAYIASKFCALSLTEWIAAELKGTYVYAVALCLVVLASSWAARSRCPDRRSAS